MTWWSHRAVLGQDLRRRHDAAGARSRPRADQDRPALVLCGRRSAVARASPSGRGLCLCRGPQDHAPGRAPRAASAACCRWTDMPASSGWPAIAPTIDQFGVLLGAHAARLLPVPCVDQVAARGRGADARPRRSTRSRRRSAAIRRAPTTKCGRQRSRPIVEALHDWLHDHLRGSPARPIWRRPCATRYVTGPA